MVTFFLLAGVLLNTAAQLLLKAGMNQIGHFEFKLANFYPVGIKILESPSIIVGVVLYIISVGLWLLVLSRVQVSLAYPLLSIGYVLNAVAAYYFFGEPMTAMRIMGIFVIIAGVYMLAQS